jgi:predicted DNA-binding transcriptional regulator AlpA
MIANSVDQIAPSLAPTVDRTGVLSDVKVPRASRAARRSNQRDLDIASARPLDGNCRSKRNHEREHEQNARNDLSNHRSQALTEHEVARQLGLSVATLRAWRLKGKGPRFARFGRAVRYLADDVERFVKASVVEPSRHVGDANL